MTRKKMWFPIVKLSIFFVVVSTSFYFFLTAFDPHIARDPADWESKKVNPKKAFWLRVIEKQITSPKK